MKRSSSNLIILIIIGVGASIAVVLVSLLAVYGSILGADGNDSTTLFRYRCNITIIVQGDIGDLKGINRILVFSNTTNQMVFFEDVRCMIDGRNVMWYLVIDDGGNTILTFDLPQRSIGNGSTVAICFSAKIAQKALTCNFSIDELKKATLDEIPLNLAELYSNNGSTWPISIEIHNLSYELAGEDRNIFNILSAFSKWIEENVAYPLNQSVKAVIGPQFPNETYKMRVGDCDDCSILFTTMCRALGIPSFIQIGGIPNLALQEEVTRYHGNYVYKSSGISWHAWSMVYFPSIGWVPVDIVYFDGAKMEFMPGGLVFIKSPLGLAPRIVSSAYFKANPIIYANITTLDYIREVRSLENAIAEGRIKYILIEELSTLNYRSPLPIEEPLILGGVLILVLLIIFLHFKRRKRLLKEMQGTVSYA
ncbi:MAG: transglutaminase-like domain-containing protein [Candidatus Nezhaarchaeales archaeon]